jgi:microcystin degradation protein MlrC
MKPRVVIGGILHETNTFARGKTEYKDFMEGRALGACRGNAILKKFRHANIGIGGFIREAERRNITLIPLQWNFAQPSGIVRHTAYTRLRDQFLAGLKAVLPVDGVFLELHGAMVTTRCEDAEGDLLKRVRKLVGMRTIIIAVLDLHANITPLMVKKADILIGYDTYPHLDIGERGEEAGRLMELAIRGKIKPVSFFRQLPLLTTAPRQCTLLPPMCDVFRLVHAMEKQPDVLSITFSGGFPFADIKDAGASIVVTTDNNRKLAEKLADDLAVQVWRRRKEFMAKLTPVKKAIAYALKTGKEPVVLADGSDNPGGGAPCDGTVMLKALVEANVPSAVVAVIADPEAVAAARKAGIGKRITLRVGGKTDRRYGPTLTLTGLVKVVGKKSFFNKGPMMTGMRVDMGWAAVFVVNNVEIILTENRFQPFDAEAIRCFGIEPRQRLIVGLKSAVHYRSSYQDMASKIFEVDTPGMHTPDLSRYRYRHIRRPIYPLDDMKSSVPD